MDSNQFDRVTRVLAQSISRRRTVGVLAAAGLAGLGGESAAARHRKHKCKNGHKLCGGVCVNVRNDPHNCGTCGNACPSGDTCHAGACVCPPQCQGKTCGPDGCGGSCGDCAGPTCQGTTLTTQTCDAGVCTPQVTNCGSGQVCFQNACCTRRKEPSCHKTSISDGCGGTYPPNCTHFCCDGPGGTLVCQTNVCP